MPWHKDFWCLRCPGATIFGVLGCFRCPGTRIFGVCGALVQGFLAFLGVFRALAQGFLVFWCGESGAYNTITTPPTPHLPVDPSTLRILVQNFSRLSLPASSLVGVTGAHGLLTLVFASRFSLSLSLSLSLSILSNVPNLFVSLSLSLSFSLFTECCSYDGWFGTTKIRFLWPKWVLLNVDLYFAPD